MTARLACAKCEAHRAPLRDAEHGELRFRRLRATLPRHAAVAQRRRAGFRAAGPRRRPRHLGGGPRAAGPRRRSGGRKAHTRNGPPPHWRRRLPRPPGPRGAAAAARLLRSTAHRTRWGLLHLLRRHAGRAGGARLGCWAGRRGASGMLKRLWMHLVHTRAACAVPRQLWRAEGSHRFLQKTVLPHMHGHQALAESGEASTVQAGTHSRRDRRSGSGPVGSGPLGPVRSGQVDWGRDGARRQVSAGIRWSGLGWARVGWGRLVSCRSGWVRRVFSRKTHRTTGTLTAERPAFPILPATHGEGTCDGPAAQCACTGRRPAGAVPKKGAVFALRFRAPKSEGTQ